MTGSHGGRLPSRTPGVISRAIGDEFVVIHPETETAHSLSGLHARVWAATEGDRPNANDFGAERLDDAVADLTALGLLSAVDGLSRRALINRAGVVGGAVITANVATILLPEAAFAASTTFTQGVSGAIPAATTIPAGTRSIGFTIVGAGGAGRLRAVGGGGATINGRIRRTDGGLFGTGTTAVTGYVGAGGLSSGAGGAGGTSNILSGGAGGTGSVRGGGGGGATSILIGGVLVVVAGGGGGAGISVTDFAGNGGSGSVGAGNSGLQGTTQTNKAGVGGGGTTSGPGARGDGSPTAATGRGTAGDADSAGTTNGGRGNGGAGGSIANSDGGAGGGGGGGFYGGGGGGAATTGPNGNESNSGAGGGAGSSFTSPTATYVVSELTGGGAGNGGTETDAVPPLPDGGSGSVRLTYSSY